MNAAATTQEPAVGVVDQTMPDGRWQFDAGVTAAFDDMLARSIPDYANMRALCSSVGNRFVQHGTDIVDLGCSRGEALAPFIEKFGAYCRYVGVEVSQPMLEASRRRFAGLIDTGIVSVRGDDLRAGYPPVNASLTLAILTLQFVPIEHRAKVVRNAFRHTAKGGAMIVVEKVLGRDADVDEALVDLYLNEKRRAGYSEDQIARKRLALEGVLVPLTAAGNERMLEAEGWQVECFWRSLNFAGWLCTKRA